MTSRPAILLAAGASGSPRPISGHVAGLRRRGFEVITVSLPRGPAERAVPAYVAAIDAAPARLVAGGHSFGGRVASLAARERRPAGLLLFSYPLHPPGRPSTERAAHWPGLDLPVLLVSGDRDEFARIDLLREAAAALPAGRLEVLEGAGHWLGARLEEALDLAAAFVDTLART